MISSGMKFLRVTFLAGLILFVLTGAVLSAFYFIERSNTRITRQQDNFTRSLYDFDIQFSEITARSTITERDHTRLNRELERLEKMAIGVESWLSILKRRRSLVRLYPPSLENYRKSVNSALEAFPASQPVMAIAAEALVWNTAINKDTDEHLRNLIPQLNDPVFNNLCLGLHVIMGDFSNPEKAAFVPSTLFSDGTEAITIDLTILKIIRGNIQSAAYDIQTLLQSPSPSVDTLRLAAEFYYDFGDLARSAEIFSHINDERSLVRQADALYLAGYKDSARSIWSMLANERSYYNLGVTAEDSSEATAHFQKLMDSGNLQTMGSDIQLSDNGDNSLIARQFGLLHYSRLLDTEQAIALLQNSESLQPTSYPYIDLELCRRQAPLWELGRQIAEAWQLLDRHDDNEELYRWAAWLFLFQRNYSELRILMNRWEMEQFTSQWPVVTKAILLMFEGDLETAEEILRSIPSEESEWTVHANLGRIMEAYRSPSRALEQYELAASKVQNPRTAARIQINIARCFSVLGRPSDAFRAIQYALDLEPENLTARMEMDRY